ncbi:hypothetical protein N1851_004867 [Merluccius polli]|uniref:Uncharacterized protein n=1 Tax=Merluccius polli TaxID=89951 RepID=A0AA47N6Q1_MERPO|nr:hypothetical protein N1851_004867 [Merluccius polli]
MSFTGLAEVLRQEGVDDRVHRRVAVGQAVGRHPQHEGRLVQGEVAELHPQVDHVVGQPGQAEHHHHHQHRLGQGEVLASLEQVLVVHHRGGHGQGQYPYHHHPYEGMPRHADGRGLSGVHDGHVSVHGHGGQREDADQHGHREEVVDELADERAQHPGGHHVDGGLEGDARQQVGQVRDAEVEDEDVGGAPGLAGLVPGQHRDHHGVAQDAQREDEPEHQQRHEIIRADAEQKFLVLLLLQLLLLQLLLLLQMQQLLLLLLPLLLLHPPAQVHAHAPCLLEAHGKARHVHACRGVSARGRRMSPSPL